MIKMWGNLFLCLLFEALVTKVISVSCRKMISYKNNYRSEGIRVANAWTKVIIFCKSRPLNWN